MKKLKEFLHYVSVVAITEDEYKTLVEYYGVQV